MSLQNKPSKAQKESLQTELEISPEEYKELKKELKKLKDRDDRAFLDMLRLTSSNHYKLNQMVDRKAHIMIMVNSIILSLVVGKLIGEGQHNWKYIPIIFMGVVSMISIIYSVLAIQPEVKHGEFGVKQLEKKVGNLLFFGNFLKLNETHYEEVIANMVEDREYIYKSIIRDIYYLGTVLLKKHIHLRVALTVFMIGIVISALLSIFLRIFVGSM